MEDPKRFLEPWQRSAEGHDATVMRFNEETILLPLHLDEVLFLITSAELAIVDDYEKARFVATVKNLKKGIDLFGGGKK